MKRPRHPKKLIEDAIVFAEMNGWTINKRPGKGHAWGVARWQGHCTVWIWTTPKVEANHAKETAVLSSDAPTRTNRTRYERA